MPSSIQHIICQMSCHCQISLPLLFLPPFISLLTAFPSIFKPFKCPSVHNSRQCPQGRGHSSRTLAFWVRFPGPESCPFVSFSRINEGYDGLTSPSRGGVLWRRGWAGPQTGRLRALPEPAHAPPFTLS